VRDPGGGSGNCGQECCPVIFAEMTTSTPFRDLLLTANLRHGTDGFTCPPKEGVLKIFLSIYLSGFGGLGVACWPLVPKFAGSNPAVGILRAKKSSARLPSEGK